MDWRAVFDGFYPEGDGLRALLWAHSRAVADLALEIARQRGLDLDPSQIEAAAMLHDVGIKQCDAPGIGCHGTAPYLHHGVLGGEMLKQAGAPEWAVEVARRHTGAGITDQQAAQLGLPMGQEPDAYLPRTQLEGLICYADKFYSKSGDPTARKPLERVRKSMAKFGPDTVVRFEALHREFAI